jgi:hypothetical protein|tara:strand:+ start:577 stop:759 length:183 start_codon:yes stop_codon:yes gene_type:complete
MKRLARLAGAVGVLHAGEDVLLMSLGRWLPVPWPVLFGLGIILSAVVLTVLIQKFTINER